MSPLVDCFDGYISNWTIGLSPNAELVNTMLKDYIDTLSDDEKELEQMKTKLLIEIDKLS